MTILVTGAGGFVGRSLVDRLATTVGSTERIIATDVAFAEQFLADHGDSFEHKTQANERTLCGHIDASPRGVKEWSREAYAPDGAVQGKATDSNMAANMSFVAHAGHPCGEDFIADKFLDQHPEFSWQKTLLRDMKAGPWTKFTAGDKAEQ